MQIIVNGEPANLQAATLASALVELDLDDATVATALNGAFVPIRARAATPLNEGDHLEVLAPMQGG